MTPPPTARRPDAPQLVRDPRLRLAFGLELGIRLPYRGRQVSGPGLIRVATEAEAAGFSSGWVGDHIVFPVELSSKNPSTKTGSYARSMSEPQLEALTTLAYAAAVTSTMRLVVGVLVSGNRMPLVIAKQAATLDLLSEGRFELGLGIGWLHEEFVAVGGDFAQRVGRMMETIAILKACWASDTPQFAGRYSSFGPVHFSPKPQLPIFLWMGGHSEPAVRRAAENADGWVGFNLSASEVSRYAQSLATQRAEGKGPIRICANNVVLTDDVNQLFRALHELREAGCTDVVLDCTDDSADGLLRLVSRFDNL